MTFISVLLLLLSGFLPADQSRLRTFHLIEKWLTQSEARAACRTNYTDLVTVYSEEDNAALSDLAKNSTDSPWIGLYHSQPRAKWSNGDNVTFSDLKGDCGTGLCCAALKADGSWESLKCTENRTFMCYKQDATDLTFSYSLVLKSLTWYEAQSHCRENYTDLVSIRDQTQNEEVRKEGGSSSGSFWIGLLRDDWEWSDGGRSAYRNWGSSHPQAPPSNCTRLTNGKWVSVPCINNQSALCYRSFLPADQSRLRTFHLIEKRMIQSEARAACRTNYTDLVTVYSEEDNAALSDLVKNSTDPPWIGLYHSQPRAKWSNGDNVTFSDLKGDCGTGLCCAALKADGSWESLKCTENRTFMCYKQDATDPTFNYSLVLKNLTWYEAQSHCRKFYTDLVSIRDQTQNEEVKKEGRNSSGSFWIGLLRDDWEWSDGGYSAYRNWGMYQPQASSSNCTRLINGKWNSAPCKNNQFALCYRTSIHVSAEPMSWSSALDYCKKENRKDLLSIESELDQKEVGFELKRRRVSGPLWVRIGQNRLTELMKSIKLPPGTWTNSSKERAFKQKTEISQLRAVCEAQT